MWLQLAEGALLLGDFVYHRWFDKPDNEKPLPIQEIQLPRTDVGAPVPLIYGQCRVRAPILSWANLENDVGGTPLINAMFVCGIPFAGGGPGSQNRVIGMWGGEKKFTWTGAQTGDGGPEAVITAVLEDEGEGRVETLNGNPSQELIADTENADDARTYAGRRMAETALTGLSAKDIPGYRGVVSAFLHELGAGSGWRIDNGRNLPAYSFEVSSLVTSLDASKWPAAWPLSVIVQDSNPINVLYDLITGRRGKLGLPASVIDMPSFQAAAYTLWTESHGYSRCFDQAGEARALIREILEQIDGVLYEDATTSTLKIKLIRPDYDPTLIPVINSSNCSRLENLAIGGWSGLPNLFRLTFTNRADGYRDGSATASSIASAVGQDGKRREQALSMPGVHTQELADKLVEREAAYLSRPLIKCTAIVDRSFLRVNPGDPIKLVWRQPDISGLVFRVARVDRGSLANGEIKLDLIQDVFYVWRDRPPVKTDFGGHTFDGGGLTLSGG
jgi:hypothetical protein